MPMDSRRLAAFLPLLLAAGDACASEALLADGLYEVEYRLDLPHLETHEVRTSTVCLHEIGGQNAFPALSANNPPSACPAAKLKRDGSDLAFEIVCPGGGAARASALFSVTDNRFQGSIAMTMGGKNMTMTEVQRGKRIGDCEPPTR